MMNARFFSIAGVTAALLMGAATAQANPFEGDRSIAPSTVATSVLTRAEVQAQVTDSQRNGSMAVIGYRINTHQSSQQASTLTRAQVRAEAAAAMRAGKLHDGEGSFGE